MMAVKTSIFEHRKEIEEARLIINDDNMCDVSIRSYTRKSEEICSGDKSCENVGLLFKQRFIFKLSG
jgi:hypothetical protein